MNGFWNKFFDAWNKSTIVSGMLAIGLLGLLAYCVVSGQDIPETISLAFVSLIAWFFGAKGTAEAKRAVAAIQAAQVAKDE